MHGSGNAVFVAAVRADLCAVAESLLIFEHRLALDYNKQGKRKRAIAELVLTHAGDQPVW